MNLINNIALKISSIALLMDSNSGFIWNPSTDLHSVYYHQTKEDHDGVIDLGLSLKTLEPESSSPHRDGGKSKERWVYVKVNMDGVVVGRKICMAHHGGGGYSNLAHQLEDMFGRQTVSGLRLFEDGSEFSLCYMDKEDNWRTVADVPWKEFVDSAKRIRITRKTFD